MANEIITTLHPDQDPDTNLYPNIKKENIPDGSIDRTKLDDNVNGLLNNIGELHPSGVDTSTNILAFTTDKGIYIGSNTGHWYYWDGTQYVDGGVYQATEIPDNSITSAKIMDGQSLKIFDANAFDKDANNAIKNSIVSVTTSGWLNLPPNYANGNLLTIGGQIANTSFQIFYVASSIVDYFYIRRQWGSTTWTNWKRLATEDFVNNNLVDYVKLYPILSYPNFNDAPKNSIISYTSLSGVTNNPIDEQGILFTYGSIDSTKTQIYNAKDSNRLFIRIFWGTTWKDWKELLSGDNLPTCNLLAMYSNLRFIGDSLTYSQVYTSATTSRQARQTYPQIVSKLSGNIPFNAYAFGGANAKTWWDTYNQYLVDGDNLLNIVYLGTNNGLTDTIDTDCVGDDLTQFADTLTGNYGKILQRIKDLGQKAILIKIYVTNGDLNTTNSVIEQFGERYNFPVIDAIKYYEDCYHYYPDKTGTNGVHYNDLGYSRFANTLIQKINNLDETMLTRLVN